MIPSIPLNSGTSIPQLGLGTAPLDDARTADAVAIAAEVGYRHIDTATRYGNETGAAEGIRRSGIDRGEFFITTKLDGPFQGDDRAVGGLEAALDRMRLDYVDLLLIHWPLPARDQYVSTWRTFERLFAESRARAIGVSNFKPAHLERLAAEADVVPAVNQVGLNPVVPRRAEREYDAAHGIVTESYSPLGGAGASVLRQPTVAEIAAKHERSAAQVVLRWHIQNGLVVIPKSGSRERITENAAIFDFALDDDDLARLDELDGGPGGGYDSDRDGH